MEQDAGTTGATLNGDRDPDQLRREIERTRQELGDTVAALAEKTDVKARARDKVDEVKHRVADRRDEVVTKAKGATPESVSHGAGEVAGRAREHPLPVAIAAAAAAGYLLGRLHAR